jgi:ubiquinone/menaquinone biosynthesis C-methylase UbiE/uncharacterized protein YbaR (Trm112 family)
MSKFRLWWKVIWAALSSRSNQIFYDRISSIYDEVFVDHRVHAENMLKILSDIYTDHKHETLVLDLGCGTGILSTMLAEKDFKVVGLDISFLSLHVLRQRNKELDIIQADANYLPIADGSFHTVVCLGVWRHFPDVQKVLNEVSRVLTSDGTFIVGYFPPAIAGAIHVNQNWCGRSLIWLYQLLTRRLGYLDRADFTLEDETEDAAREQFKTVRKVASGSHKYLMLARYPLRKHSACHIVSLSNSLLKKTQAAVSHDLMRILRCPHCVTRKTHKIGEDSGRLDMIRDDWLVCREPECGRKYPVRDGIAVMLAEEGKKWINVEKDACTNT